MRRTLPRHYRAGFFCYNIGYCYEIPNKLIRSDNYGLLAWNISNVSLKSSMTVWYFGLLRSTMMPT